MGRTSVPAGPGRSRFARALFAAVGVVALVGAAGSARAATAGHASGRSLSAFAVPHTSPAQHIQHVVVFYQENHSFDETLGRFCQVNNNRCDGYTGPVHLSDGTVADMTQSPDLVPDVWHDVQTQRVAVDRGAMDGWDRVTGCTVPVGRACLTYYAPSQIPSLAALASKFVVSDHTFSMQDSPSWGGHVYPAAATQDNFTGDIPTDSKGNLSGAGWGCDVHLLTPWIDPNTHRRSMQPSCIPARPGTLDPNKYPYNGPYRASPVQWVPTIFDRLDAKHLSWKLYSSFTIWSICPNFAECQFGPQSANVVRPTDFLTDVQSNSLPAYSVLLPGGPNGTSQHNGTSMLAGDNWIGQVLNTLEHSPEWSSTAVFITYDDCGCFYDHVAPGTNPDGTRQGVRVPMVIVSPYAKVAFTDTHPATFASILRFTEETFGLSPLSVNDQQAYDFSGAFDFAAAPTGGRVTLTRHQVPASSRRYTAAHPEDPHDPT